MDISNGPGIRISIFMQGCTFNCKHCFIKETHDFNGGKAFTDETIDRVIALAKPDYIVGLSILGGEPLHPKNIEGTTKLAKKVKSVYPDKNIWLWTGFTWETIENKEILEYLDVLVDGQFKETLHDPRLKWCGSSNQRVIDVQRSLKEEKIVLYESEN